MQVNPYLDFNGRCEEAVEYYRRALGAEVMPGIHRFKDSPDQQMVKPATENKVMHMSFRLGDLTILCSDGECGGQPSLQGFSLAVNLRDENEAKRIFNALSDGGQIKMPLTKTFFSPAFGMLTDRFGVGWMIHVAPAA